MGGIKITVLASTQETGSYEMFHGAGAEGKGPGPHHHPWDESLLVTQGEVRVGVASEEIVATPGSFIHIPAGTPHWFTCSDGAEFITTTSAGNAAAMFTDFDQKVNWDSPDRDALVALAAQHQQIILG
ncbi:cupin 2, conserved barrel [Luminiphilus syltensis NOR5-1B]|uniref:Cupin 2, conserved barrel n=1 Tax=Luminiphilus syltensis NOR5-1B TaxID=565045 RepID=B8KU04_9GAMM|nr:cupin 2, conserved barrel [Luminiphilus syltensis NOR5-1B]